METNKKNCSKCNKSPVKFTNPLVLLAVYISITSIYGNYLLFKKLFEYLSITF